MLMMNKAINNKSSGVNALINRGNGIDIAMLSILSSAIEITYIDPRKMILTKVVIILEAWA